MKILLINQYAGAPPYGMEYRAFHFASEWRRLGHEVTIVGGTYSHLRFHNPIETSARQPDIIDGIRMVWLPVPRYLGNGLARGRNILVFAARLLIASGGLARVTRPDLIITSSTHPMDIYGGLHIAKLAGAQLFHEVHDLWPLTLIELGGLPSWHPFVRLLQMAEDRAYREARLVVSMLPAALPYMVKHGLDPSRFRYIPNGVAVEDWEHPQPLPRVHEEALDRIRVRSGFVVGYAGGFALSNDLESLLQSPDHLYGRDVHIVLVGEGAQRQRLQSRFASERITFLPAIPKLALPSLLSRFDACFLGAKRSPLYRFGVNPNKMFDYMMAGRPIICAMASANDPVSESSAGLTVAPESPEAVAEAIERLASESNEERRERGESGRQYVLKHHDYRVLAARFLEGLA